MRNHRKSYFLIFLSTMFFLFVMSNGSEAEETTGFVFVTAGTWTGDLGGLSGADDKCNADANRPRTDLTYEAMLLLDGGPDHQWNAREYTKICTDAAETNCWYIGTLNNRLIRTDRRGQDETGTDDCDGFTSSSEFAYSKYWGSVGFAADGGPATDGAINDYPCHVALPIACISIPDVVTVTCVGFEPPMDKIIKVKKKNRVLPLKMVCYDGDTELTDLDIAPPVVDVDYVDSNGDPGAVEEVLYAGQGDEGNQFVYSDGYWRFNLQTKNFSAYGTYTITAVSGDTNSYNIEIPEPEATFLIE